MTWLHDARHKDEFLRSDDFVCSARLWNCLNNDDSIQTVADLRYSPDHVIRRIPNLGKVSLAELRRLIPYVDPSKEPRWDDSRSWWERAIAPP